MKRTYKVMYTMFITHLELQLASDIEECFVCIREQNLSCR